MRTISVISYVLQLFLLVCMTACEDVNSKHQKYLDAGETQYIGKVDSVEVWGGKEKAKFTWQINTDPRIVSTIIYWNNRNDMEEVPVNRIQPGVMNMEAIINVAERAAVNFELVTMDEDGNYSIPVLKSTQIYGPNYISQLDNRKMSAVFDGNSLTINWGIVESSSVQYTTVRYTDYSDTSNPTDKSVRVENDDNQTLIEGVRGGDKLNIVTTYMPSGCFEMLDALPSEQTIF